jgi:hypothetical protein
VQLTALLTGTFRLLSIGGLVFIPLAGVYLIGLLTSGSTAYRLDRNCRVSTFLGETERFVLRSKFWRAQHDLIEKQIRELESVPQERARLAELKREAAVRASEKFEQVCRSNPDLCKRQTSPAQRAAAALREQADAIEMVEAIAVEERARMASLSRLAICKRVAARAADGP